MQIAGSEFRFRCSALRVSVSGLGLSKGGLGPRVVAVESKGSRNRNAQTTPETPGLSPRPKASEAFFKISERRRAFHEEFAAVRLHLRNSKVNEQVPWRHDLQL